MITIGSNPHKEYETLLLSPLVLDGALDNDEVKRILAYASQIELEPGTVNGGVNTEHRSCKIGWLHYTDTTAWLYGRLYDLVSLANRSAFYFDPLDFIEPIMYADPSSSQSFPKYE